MRFHSQNLNEPKSMFRHGRCWLRNILHREMKFEWALWKRSPNMGAYLSFGNSEDDDGLMLVIHVPFIMSLYMGITGAFRVKKAFQCGIQTHDNAIWFYPASYTMESNRTDPWWRRTHCWNFPWQLDWYCTEVLDHKANLPGLQKTAWIESRAENRKARKAGKRDWCGVSPYKDDCIKSVSETYDYTYTLKCGTVQHRKATVHVNRMEWRARWYPLIWRRKVSTTIDVVFNEEVGERTGSWKGGCIGCGYEMKLGETPLDTLRRMEKERAF